MTLLSTTNERIKKMNVWRLEIFFPAVFAFCQHHLAAIVFYYKIKHEPPRFNRSFIFCRAFHLICCDRHEDDKGKFQVHSIKSTVFFVYNVDMEPYKFIYGLECATNFLWWYLFGWTDPFQTDRIISSSFFCSLPNGLKTFNYMNLPGREKRKKMPILCMEQAPNDDTIIQSITNQWSLWL